MKNPEKYSEFKKLVAEIRDNCADIIGQVDADGNKITVNCLLKQCYAEQYGGIDDFKTYKQWKEEGRQVKKGESSHIIFSRPIFDIKKEKGEEIKDGEKNFFSTCNVFHINQTEEAAQ